MDAPAMLTAAYVFSASGLLVLSDGWTSAHLAAGAS